MFDRIRAACAYVTGTVTAFFGAITINDVAVFVGTFAVNYYFKSQENKRAQEEHDARMGNK